MTGSLHGYLRGFELHASHFNEAHQYAQYRTALQCVDADPALASKILFEVVRDSHGHNFYISVKVEAENLDDQGFVVDDEKLEATVREWDRTNLSVHADFTYSRATTERMAERLARKVAARLLSVRFGKWSVSVAVTETDHIVAHYTVTNED